ncbi:hypothetical protein BDN70DRAFT_807911, partial [Pholiota conissans]
ISSNTSSKRTHHPNRITTMSSTSSSTSSLPMSQRQPTPKDYESSFVNLSSQYGFGGSSMPSLPRKSAKTTTSTTSSSSTSQPASKAPSVQQSTATHSQKDFEASFAQLSTSYGYGGGFSLPTRQ